jgi:hypothetical protein
VTFMNVQTVYTARTVRNLYVGHLMQRMHTTSHDRSSKPLQAAAGLARIPADHSRAHWPSDAAQGVHEGRSAPTIRLEPAACRGTADGQHRECRVGEQNELARGGRGTGKQRTVHMGRAKVAGTDGVAELEAECGLSVLTRLRMASTGAQSELWQLNESTSRQVCGPQKHGLGVLSHLRRPERDRIVGSGAVRVHMGFEAFSRHFGAFDDSPADPTMRSSKELDEGVQRMRADRTTTRKMVDSCLVEALTSRDGPSRGHFSGLLTIGRGRKF